MKKATRIIRVRERGHTAPGFGAKEPEYTLSPVEKPGCGSTIAHCCAGTGGLETICSDFPIDVLVVSDPQRHVRGPPQRHLHRDPRPLEIRLAVTSDCQSLSAAASQGPHHRLLRVASHAVHALAEAEWNGMKKPRVWTSDTQRQICRLTPRHTGASGLRPQTSAAGEDVLGPHFPQARPRGDPTGR